MKSDSYINIQGWMINELELKSNELLVFAVIYGFSKDNAGKFTGSISYLQKTLNISKNTVINTLNSLLEKELIVKETTVHNGITFCNYLQNEPVVQKLVWGGAKIGTEGGAKIGINNTNKHKSKINNSNNSDFFSFLIENEVESDIADDYVKFRKAKKAPLTIRVGESLKKEAYTAGYTLNDAIKICLMRGWVGFDSKWLKTPQNMFNKNTITNGTEQPRTNRNR